MLNKSESENTILYSDSCKVTEVTLGMGSQWYFCTVRGAQLHFIINTPPNVFYSLNKASTLCLWLSGLQIHNNVLS